MNLIRKYKIAKINNSPISGREGEIIDFIESKLLNIDLYTYYKHPKNIFLMSSEGEWVIEIDPEMDMAYIRYENFWLVLRTIFNMEKIDIQVFILFLLHSKYNISVNHIESFDEIDYSEMENFYKKDKNI